jgi:NADH-quinone oxidoreductase subunit L
MTVPLVVLAAGAVAAGYIGLPEALTGGRIPNYFHHLLEHSIARAGRLTGHQSHSTELVLMTISALIAGIGIIAGRSWFGRNPLWKPPRLLEEKYRVDELYDTLIVSPVRTVSTAVLWRVVDTGIIDGAVNGAGRLAALTGSALRLLQSGLARAYAAMVVLGALILIGYFIIR